MMNETKYGKSIAAQILKKYKLVKPSLDELVFIASENGYDIIDYSKNENLDSIITLADRLSIQSYIETGTAFTYKNNETRLIFLCESMTNDEKLYALAHELGHILCNHFSTNSQSVSSVKEEREANEFAHYLLEPSFCVKVNVLLSKYKKLLIIVALILLVVIVAFLVWKYAIDEKPYSQEYYRTTNGEKYHEKDCIVIKDKNNVKRVTEKDMRTKKYEPCQVCLP